MLGACPQRGSYSNVVGGSQRQGDHPPACFYLSMMRTHITIDLREQTNPLDKLTKFMNQLLPKAQDGQLPHSTSCHSIMHLLVCCDLFLIFPCLL